MTLQWRGYSRLQALSSVFIQIEVVRQSEAASFEWAEGAAPKKSSMSLVSE